MNRFNLLIILALGLLIACGKEDEPTAYKEAITVLQPSTNPANTVKGAAIKYEVVFTNDEYIDSVQAFINIDSLDLGYDEARDSLIQKTVYPVGNQSNQQTMKGSFTPKRFPIVGRKIYLIFKLRSKTKNIDKRVNLVVT